MNKTFNSFRNGLTMLELVFVIVILGIVASISSSIIAQVYESYIVQRSLYHANMKSELAAMQIGNRLSYRISSSVIGRVPDSTTFKPLDELRSTDGETHTVLEWIAYDNDSFSAASKPGWSGFCDVRSTFTTRTKIYTPGSNLYLTNSIIINLSGATKNIASAAIIFAGHQYAPSKNYAAECMGFTNSSCISPVYSISTGTSIDLEDNRAKMMRDQYKLVWSAYAIVPTTVTGSELTNRGFKEGDAIYDLTLHYNYQPWNTNAPSSYANGESSILVTNVTSFRFTGKGDTVRFKICVIEPMGDSNVTSCKEKAVIR